MKRSKSTKNRRKQLNQPKPAHSWTRLVLTAALGTACILGLWIVLVPLKEPSVPSDEPESLAPARTSVDNSAAFTGYELPRSGDSLTTEQLQAQLQTIADSLSSEFPTDPTALHVAASIHAELRRTQKARQLWEECLKLGKIEVGPVLGLVEILAQSGEDQAAIEWMEKLKNSSTTSLPEAYFVKLAELYSQFGELEKSESVALEGLNKIAESPVLLSQLALAQSQLQKLDESEAAFRKAIQLGDNSSGTRNAFAVVLNRLGKSDEARQLLAQNNASGQPLNDQPAVESNNTEDSEFQERYRGALREISIPLIRNATAVALAHRSFEQAEKWIRIAIAEQPMNPALYMDLAAALRGAGRLPAALVVHERLVQVQPDNLLNDINLASLANQLNRADLAERVLLTAFNKSPKSAFLLGELAKLALARRDFQAMGEYAAKAQTLEPENVDWPLMQAIAAQESNRTADTQLHLQRARQLSPNDPRLLDFQTNP